ncbi:hypothetical protein P153DRAFT_350361 [Dothidotthia symphoricarpi CBS 119687]|uniref:RING-type domain-containing protein n=1 Tax=Dothidotthia symphoricarpi CBS 119687 TaxID=1392245 RepID=A0A6A6A1E7_9PLEO|nr:uncharacterized protein P153DRAFT_350361 [Dothidotthia symphoricarpi CBS 119687]KAF2124381.1 hypothetical protein P153DRAFT_350361 [Dothidotthia symphoricarpi CBS 119687]
MALFLHNPELFGSSSPANSPICEVCLATSLQPSPLNSTTAPGPIYTLPRCNHTTCRTCLTTHYGATLSPHRDITCPTCLQPCGFQLKPPHFTLYNTRHRKFLSQGRHIPILNPASPHYAGTQPLLLTRADSLAILAALQNDASAHYGTTLATENISHVAVFQKLGRYLANCEAVRLTTPELLQAEFKLMIEELVLEHVLLQPGAKYHSLAKNFRTEDAERDFDMLCHFVRGVKLRHPEFRVFLERWEGVVRWFVGVVAMRWWERFEFAR